MLIRGHNEERRVKHVHIDGISRDDSEDRSDHAFLIANLSQKI